MTKLIAYPTVNRRQTVSIPDSVTEIGINAITNPKEVLTYSVADTNPAFVTKDGVLFDKEEKTLFYYPGLKECSEYAIPDSVTTIGRAAFAYNQNLHEIYMPDSVTTLTTKDGDIFASSVNLEKVRLSNKLTEIPGGLFYFAQSITSIEIPQGVNSIGYAAFGVCPKLESISIPASVTEIHPQAITQTDATIYCTKGSVAEQYAIDNEMNYVLVD